MSERDIEAVKRVYDEQVRRGVAGARTHLYRSTACQHELHGQCRQACKFCEAVCDCACHLNG